MRDMVISRQAADKKEEHYDLFSSLLEASESEALGDGGLKLNDTELISEWLLPGRLFLINFAQAIIFIFLLPGHEVRYSNFTSVYIQSNFRALPTPFAFLLRCSRCTLRYKANFMIISKVLSPPKTGRQFVSCFLLCILILLTCDVFRHMKKCLC